MTLAIAALAGCASNAPSSVLAEGPRMIDVYRGTVVVAEDAAGPAVDDASGPDPRCRWWLFTWPCERAAAAAEAPGAPISDAPTPGGETASYTRTAADELEFLFPRLPNPDIYIHVLPHLATEALVPVPGYTTAVPLYERVEYALPGELDHATRLLEPGADGAGGEADGRSTGRDPDSVEKPPAEPEGSP